MPIKKCSSNAHHQMPIIKCPSTAHQLPTQPKYGPQRLATEIDTWRHLAAPWCGTYKYTAGLDTPKARDGDPLRPIRTADPMCRGIGTFSNKIGFFSAVDRCLYATDTPATASTASWLHFRVKGSNRQINGSNLVWVYPPKAKTCHGVMTRARPYLERENTVGSGCIRRRRAERGGLSGLLTFLVLAWRARWKSIGPMSTGFRQGRWHWLARTPTSNCPRCPVRPTATCPSNDPNCGHPTQTCFVPPRWPCGCV